MDGYILDILTEMGTLPHLSCNMRHINIGKLTMAPKCNSPLKLTRARL